MINGFDLFRSCVALLAFVMAFYALLARERKTPYMVHSVYRIAFIFLSILILTATSKYAERFGLLNWSNSLKWIAEILLIIGFVYVFIKLCKEHNRHKFFRDDQLFKHSIPGRAIQNIKTVLRKRTPYEHNPLDFPESLKKSLRASPHIDKVKFDEALEHHAKSKSGLSISAVFEIKGLADTDKALTDISKRFLMENCYVQYTACSRHPIEFLSQLKAHWKEDEPKKNWKNAAQRIVLVDACSPHFGFTDSIYRKRQEEIKNDCLDYVISSTTYAGIHTAIAKAFNSIKREDSKTVRTPTLVIYDGASALIDLESSEQYRVFVRHVLASERLWGGMFSVFFEPEIAPENIPVFSSTADMIFDTKPRSKKLPTATRGLRSTKKRAK